jgi:hypothetical protein
MRHLSTIGLVIILLLGLEFSAQAQSLSAQQIIDRMSSVYATCHSYVDEGEVKTIFLQQNSRRTVSKPFATAFVRPSDFRFEFKDRRGEDEWNSYIVWKGAESVKTWWSIRPGIESPKNLSLALAGAAGVSSGAATTVPTLLMPEMVMGNRIKSLTALKLISEEEVNGRNSYKIEGTDSRERVVTLWVDRETLLLVKIYQRTRFDNARVPFETETTTTYKPQVNAGAQGKLAFNPPEKEKKDF